MASLISHPAWPIALFLMGKRAISKQLLWLSILLTLLPDADVIAFKFGIPYASQWGHRGFTHSICFALFIGIICSFFYRWLKAGRAEVFVWTASSVLSHVLLDALTNGGLGVAWLWPFSLERNFFPFHPIQVSPIGVVGFLSLRGLIVLISEFFWIWLPLLSLSVIVRFFRRKKARGI